MAMYEWATEHLHNVDAARVRDDGELPPPRALAVA